MATFTAISLENTLIRLYLPIGSTADRLPCTAECNQLYQEFDSQTGSAYSKCGV